MQSLLRSICQAGSRGGSAKLLACATDRPAVVQQPVAYQASVNLLRHLIRPIGALTLRGLSTVGNAEVALEEDDSTSPAVEHPPRIKFKRPDKTARHIMNILNKEAVEKVRSEREIPDVQPGCIIQMRLQVPENKRRESTLKGIVIGRRNAGINTTFRLRRLVAGVGVESVFPLYSPNIKEIKILDRKKVRRAKLYYLRDRMNALKK
ncbi:hypothetical protein QOZ80_3BG0278150 [Eleusine coracana subsp. coracana]|nr:hypothetical protein QOZ80_3BG0278150 [Eleusine coracana subsp. coracana]